MIEYISEDGMVWASEEEARAHGLVYRTKRIAGQGPRKARQNVQTPQQPDEKMSEAESAALELLMKQNQPPPEKPAKRDWADRVNSAAPMTTDPDLAERAERGFGEPKEKE